MNKFDYAIYPTLLDSFYWAKRLGNWQEFIDKINRVKAAGSEKQQRGVSFESVINSMLDKTPVEHSFPIEIVNEVFNKLQNCKKRQVYVQGFVNTGMGNVKLYGFADYEYPQFYVDLKTTEKYKPGKYSINSQHKAYPLIGKKQKLIYMITDFKKVYYEDYALTQAMKDELIFELTEFIEWLEIHRDEISDKKIFNLK